MIATCPKCGGKRIEMWLCLRAAGCTARPSCESTELRPPPLPFDGEYHARLVEEDARVPALRAQPHGPGSTTTGDSKWPHG